MSTLDREACTLPAAGIAADEIAALVPPRPAPAPTRIGMVGVGLKMHFVWKDAVANLQRAAERISQSWADQPFELVPAPEAYESPDQLIPALDKLHAQGIRGLIFFHGSYTAGEIGSQLGRWLLDHPMPLLSWATPEPTGGRLTANSLCCQNFILNALSRLGVSYAWMFKAVDDPAVDEQLQRFARSARARARLIHGRALMVGAGRVPGFYDAECDELAIMKRFGLRFDRLDLVQVMELGRKYDDADVKRVMQALVDSPRCGLNNVDEQQFGKTLRLALATLELAANENYLGCAIRCWPTLFDHYHCAADGALALINDQGLPAADETDMNGLVSMLAMALLTDGAAIPTLMDISLLSEERNRLGFWHCGGSATRLLRQGTTFETRRHSILENADEATAVGMLIESLLELGPVTVTRYLSPDCARSLAFEGRIVESPMAFRGAYAEIEPTGVTADQIMGSILDQGMDHHWIVGRGHFQADLAMLNHWLDVQPCPISNAGGGTGLSRRLR